MRLFPPRRCFFHIVRNYNENFQKKIKNNDLRDEGEKLFIHDDDGDGECGKGFF